MAYPTFYLFKSPYQTISPSDIGDYEVCNDILIMAEDVGHTMVTGNKYYWTPIKKNTLSEK